MDAGVLPDEQHRCGRPSRVVLSPRRWGQASRKTFAGSDGGYKARYTGESTEQPLTPLRRECRMFRRTCG